MAPFIVSSFGLFVMGLFAGVFTTPSWQTFTLLAYGWAVAGGERQTIATYLWLSGATAEKHWSCFYRFVGGALVQAWEGIWHTVLPGRLLRVVVVRRPPTARRRKPGQRKSPPAVAAFFSTDLTLSLAAILAQYWERWTVEITLRDSNAFTGFGQDQCRRYERVVGVNTFRLA